MSQPPDHLEHSLPFDPNGDFEAFLRQAPAKWVVYLLADESDRPVQLLCVRNLRYSLKRRLGGDETVGLSKRVSYRQIVRKIFWQRVDSALEADLVYYQSARRLFPDSYQGMVGFRPAWFIHVDPDAAFPRFVKTIDLSPRSGSLIGPLADKHAAARLIGIVEDAFDLCRYYNILLQSPRGKACPYKEMGKCPAPCDGSISMEQYRRLIDWSVPTMVDPAAMIRDQSGRMQQAALALKFETAARIKSFVDQLSLLGVGPFRHARLLNDFRFVSFQRGPSEGLAKIFLITPGRIDLICLQIGPSDHPADLCRAILQADEDCEPGAVDAVGAERIGIVARHSFSPKHSQGIFLSLSEIDEKSLAKAYKALQKQKAPQAVQGEGVLKELQTIPPSDR